MHLSIWHEAGAWLCHETGDTDHPKPGSGTIDSIWLSRVKIYANRDPCSLTPFQSIKACKLEQKKHTP